MLKNKALNGWNLFWGFSALISAIMLLGMMGADLSSGPGVSTMIQLSARCAVPFVYLAFAASSLHTVFSSDGSAWVLRNRKYFGLSFAVAMAWQALFIVWMVGGYTGYYTDEVYLLRDVIEGVVGYAFLILMVITSFRPGRRQLSRKQWRVLHTSGIYFLWAYAFSVYWWAIFYSGSRVPMDFILYGLGFVAWAFRAAAWHKERMKKARKDPAWSGPNPLWRGVGGIIIAVGAWMAVSGSYWYGPSEPWVYGYTLTQIPELYVPYWPFEPFWPLGVIALGTYLLGIQGRSE
ncbi:MAG: hypothetical protein VX252_03155 [Myxococcota bacterium]|nr:hypothetical protein [Myxococcota bacterium]